MRARLLAVLAALSVLAAACGVTPAGSVATVNGSQVDYDRFARIVAARLDASELAEADARTIQDAIDVGLLDRQALDQALLGDLQARQQGGEPRIDQGPPLQVPDDFVDELYQAQPASSADEAELERIGTTPDEMRRVFGDFVPFEVRGLLRSQGQPGFPVDPAQQTLTQQQAVLSTLVQSEILAQAVDELDVAPSDEEVERAAEEIRASVPEDQFDEALTGLGYDQDDFRDLIVLPRARQQALQALEDPTEAQAFFDELDVDVADRFGRWDAEQGRLVAPGSA